MPVPSPRNKILPARGNYADLASNVASLLDGEICYAIDQDQYYQNEGGALVAVGATKAQGLLADSATQPGDNVSTLTNDAGYITSAQAPVQSVAGKTGVVTLVKGDVGLGNVDNTSDLNKPISTATQTALDLKANLASPALTGTPTAPTATAGTNTTQLATTAFVSTAVANETTNFNDLTNKTAGTGNYTTTGTFTGNTLASTVATGTAPLTVASTTLVTNLNADQLDGVEGSSFLRSDADDSFTGTITGISDASNPVLTIDGPGPNIVRFLDNGSTTAGLDVAFKTTPNTLGIQSSATADTFLTIDADTPSGCITLRGGTNNPDPVKIERGGASSDQVALQFAATGARWFGKGTDNNPYWSSSNNLSVGDEIWHAGNDGSGSGLDADLLDGVEGSGYLTTTGTQTFTNKTIGDLTETVYTITDGASVDLDPANGPIQVWTLGANRTPTATNFATGESMMLMIDDGTAYTITWPTMTWVGGSAPTLATSGYTVVELWKVSTTLYGARVGDVA